MKDLVYDFFTSSGTILWASAPFMVMGLLLGGIIKTFLNGATIQRYLGGKGVAPVLKASLLGVPIPLCSCSVLPVAMTLRKNGASRGATAAFLISTPESGVDSISVSYALLDPFLTLIRPLVAFITAFAAGVGMMVLDKGLSQRNLAEPEEFFSPINTEKSCRESPSCCSHHHPENHMNPGFWGHLKQGVSYASGELWEDLWWPFVLGILLSGLLGALVPTAFLEHWLQGGVHAMLVMLLMGIPMYICATSSTPLAAAFILKGVSPGAALVFLLAGPATNISALPVLTKILGKKGVFLYVGIIVIFSVFSGLLVDYCYELLQWNPRALMGAGSEILPPSLHLGSLAFLALCTLPIVWRKIRNRGEARRRMSSH